MDLRAQFMDLVQKEDGADATEYALLASLIAIALIVGATALGVKINNVFNFVQGKMTSSDPVAPAAG